MKAAYIEETGPPENIVYGDLPTPEPQGSEVLVKVAAVSVNPVDTYIRAGANYWELPKPFIVGCDLAGEVVALGSEARKFRAGDRVWGSNQGLLGRQGTFAEYCAVDERWLYPTPGGVLDETVAALALVGITAHLGLVRDARLRAGETIFVHGGSGGVGSAVVQIAKALGARVITTGADDTKVSLARGLGADLAINYRKEDVDAAVKRHAPEGVNVFWETRREPDFDKIVEYLAPRGRIVLMAGRDARPPFPVGPFYVKSCSMHGLVMFGATPEEQEECARDINRWLQEGKLVARIDRVLPLARTSEAHRLQEDNTLRHAGTLAGKLVLKPH